MIFTGKGKNYKHDKDDYIIQVSGGGMQNTDYQYDAVGLRNIKDIHFGQKTLAIYDGEQVLN